MKKITTKEIIIIVAYLAKTLGFGLKGGFPWKKIKADMKRFMELTMGHTVIMGLETWKSLNEEALPGRQNIIVSTTLKASQLGRKARLARTLSDAIRMATREKIFLLGGEGIFNEAMETGIVNTIEATVVHADLEFDRSFPTIPDTWESVSQNDVGVDEGSGLSIQFITLSNTLNPFPPLAA